MSEGYGFSKTDAGRVATTVRTVEAGIRGDGSSAPAAAPRFNIPGLRPARAPAGGIAAGAAGTVTYFDADPATGALVIGTETVTAINPFGAAVGASKLIWVAWFAGRLYVVIESCP